MKCTICGYENGNERTCSACGMATGNNPQAPKPSSASRPSLSPRPSQPKSYVAGLATLGEKGESYWVNIAKKFCWIVFAVIFLSGIIDGVGIINATNSVGAGLLTILVSLVVAFVAVCSAMILLDAAADLRIMRLIAQEQLKEKE